MNKALLSMLDRYEPKTLADHENALKEIVQELALLGLWRAKFYEHAAFYGGTALRIFHNLPRFSEDIDFSLMQPDSDFDLEPHLEAVRAELAAFGFSFRVERKTKRTDTSIESAFIKGETRMNLLHIGTPDYLRDRLPRPQQIRIKLEVDTDPPPLASYEVKTLLTPIPFQVRLFNLPSLFAGKLHALLCRNWRRRVKGRDFYDFVWYLGRKASCDLRHLQARMEQTGHWKGSRNLDACELRELLKKRFEQIDFVQAKNDVRPFIRDEAELQLWDHDFFESLADRIAESGTEDG